MSDQEPRLLTRHPHDPHTVAATLPTPGPRPEQPSWRSPRRLLQAALLGVVLLGLTAAIAYVAARQYIRTAATSNLPQLDGQLALPGLSAPVTVQRDAHGVPHIHAATLDDLVLAQAFITSSDRLFQMDLLRRHAAGELAEILGTAVLPHDRLQRTLQIRASADRALLQLPASQRHLLDQYSKGVNASISAQSAHLPVEFRVLRYTPAPWSARDSILVSMAMFEDLTNAFPTKLARESLTARLNSVNTATAPNLIPDLIPDLIADLYPVGSWRDHPPTTPEPDLTIPGPPIEQVPLDESQAALHIPHSSEPTPQSILANLQPLLHNPCQDCTAGSNNWVVSGQHTASGKPLLSNDMHLTTTLPGIWYEADLSAQIPGAEDLHVAGVTLPGLPLVVVGHNQHIAWGFTNLGADVQDIYLETLRGQGTAQQFQSTDGTWQPILHISELIKVKNGLNVSFDVAATRHGDTLTPILNPVLQPEAITLPGQTNPRTLSLRWTLFDEKAFGLPLLEINSAKDWPSFTQAFSGYGGPSQNVVYADDQGHIGYHAVGHVPLRGAPDNTATAAASLPADIASPIAPETAAASPVIAAVPDPLAQANLKAPAAPLLPLLSGPLSAVPLLPTAAHEWSGYIPFDQLPQAFDPQGGVIASANSRVAADDYKYPITQNWAAPYRNERIWHLLAGRTNLTPADMLAIQTDIYSDFDHVLAERLAYALDHTQKPLTPQQKQAADLLRTFSGHMASASPAAAIVSSVHAILWPMLLGPHLQNVKPERLNTLYTWGERDYALEQILMHTPPRWLPPTFTSWDDFLATAVARALAQTKTPGDLTSWRYGSIHQLDIEHPVFQQSAALRSLLGRPTGTGPQPQSGDTTTVKQVATTFGPSERFTADLSNPDATTLNIVLGQSGNPASPWFMDQFQAWYHGQTYVLPFTQPAVTQSTTHTLTLTP